MITPEVKEFLEIHKLGYVATVTKDGKPNISPKGTIISWTSSTLAFADIRSPDTVKNLQHNPNIEINVIDPILRKGFLFKGKARILQASSLYEEILEHYKNKGIKSVINSIVLVDLSSVSKVTSPLYDIGITEQQVRAKWEKYFQSL